MMIIQGFVFEMRSGMNEFDHRIFANFSGLSRCRLRSAKVRPMVKFIQRQTCCYFHLHFDENSCGVRRAI